jgi:hypothetical protein
MTTNLYNRYYMCMQNWRKYECKRYNSLESIKMIKLPPGYYLSTGELEDKHANLILPVYNRNATVFPMYIFIPSIFDKFILSFKIYNLSSVSVY